MLRGQLPMLLYKITPQEFAAYSRLRPVSIRDYPPDQTQGKTASAGTVNAASEQDVDKGGAGIPSEPSSDHTQEESRQSRAGKRQMRYIDNRSWHRRRTLDRSVQENGISEQKLEEVQERLDQNLNESGEGLKNGKEQR